MARYAPLITLGAVAALGGGLLFANSTVGGTGPSTPGPTSASSSASSPGAAPDSPSVLAQPPGQGEPPADAPPADPPAAPDAAPAVDEAAYAGRSAGNEVTVAIAVKDGRAVGYVCDGKKIEAWLEGTLTGSQLRLEGADGAALTADLTEAATLGTVTVAGKERPFAAEDVASPSGLYEGRADVRGVATRIGWIVDGEGQVTGVATARGDRRPAPALDPADPTSVTIDGVPVTVTPLDGGDEVIRR